MEFRNKLLLFGMFLMFSYEYIPNNSLSNVIVVGGVFFSLIAIFVPKEYMMQ